MRQVIEEGSFKLDAIPGSGGGALGFSLEITDARSGIVTVVMMGFKECQALGEAMVASTDQMEEEAAPVSIVQAPAHMARQFKKVQG